MTNEELAEYYANLLILQYRGQPKAYATIKDSVSPIIMDQLPVQVQDAFEVDTAVGVQLDVIGKYTGVTRYGYDTSGPITLDDDSFRKLIKLLIIQNNSGSSLYDIQRLLALYFSDTVVVFDHQHMRLSYLIDSDEISTELAEVWVLGGHIPKPMAVGICVIFAPNIDTFFGFGSYFYPAYHNSPFNTYSDYETNRPWLTYSDGRTV